ncbi:NAD(P)/FAD-dependent oxidoreductase [Paenibacillus piri]|uniref:FAD dependent oxidoreductase n=1 Tax=Paenibacillus piri TaxID=2547395 RepID=A0A4R5KKY1_9BACL|nr:FAD-dependent monooxygenase [Paenibacillus piri]TDF95090.1 FAD dependent oxidoreductase [Paenibacillus piri]
MKHVQTGDHAMNGGQAGGSALVIGGGFAGLLTARILSGYFKEVVIVEKDELPAHPGERTGTPQAFHPHRFTSRGKAVVERLFPGYENDLMAHGAPSVLNKTVYNMNQYGSVEMQYPRNDYKFSRALLEWVLRQRVEAIPNVRFLAKHDALRLLTKQDCSAVIGIQVRERNGFGRERALYADLVIDASGRSSKLDRWLAEIGYEVPQPDLLKVDIGYSTRRYKVPSDRMHLIETWDTINIAGQPANGTFTGVFSFIENHTAELLLYRPGGQYPPADGEAYEQEIIRLPSPKIAELLQGLEPITPPRGFRVPELYRRHYERMQSWPTGLLVLGDAFCIFDPIFGQGMTVAAIEAETLERCLREQWDAPKPDFEKRVLQSIQHVIEPAWWLNCANDLQWQGVEYAGSEPLQGISFGRNFMDLLLKYIMTERKLELYGLYWTVNTLSLSPRSILNAQTVGTVLNASVEGRQRLEELTGRYGTPLEQILEEVLPTFSEAPFVPLA